MTTTDKHIEITDWWTSVPHIEQHELTCLVIGFKQSYKTLNFTQISEIYNYIKN